MRQLLRLVVIFGVGPFALVAALMQLGGPWHDLSTKSVQGYAAPLPELTELSQRSIVYDRFGNVLTVLRSEENREPRALKDIPLVVRNAVLDVEDRRFYEHGGYDLRSAGRALLANTDAGAVTQGGSTITQQLVKKSILTPERTLDRKIKEAVLAERIEKVMTKDEILERYLNIIYLGNSAYGVQAAAETYFGKDVTQLQPVEAALLAGLIRNPNGYDPFLHPQAALDRRNFALDQMVEAGHLNADEAGKLKDLPVPKVNQKSGGPPQRENYFIEAVKKQLFADKRLGETPADREDAVLRGGLSIYTTFDPTAQQLADNVTRTGVPANSQNVVGALASVDPATGYVFAISDGALDYTKQQQFDVATQGFRQPGSSFKVFTLLTALENGYGPLSTVDGTGPCAIYIPGSARRTGVPVPEKDPAGQPVFIKNSEGREVGTMTLVAATANSVNCAYVRMAAALGLDKVKEMANRLGIDGGPSGVQAVPSMVIGSQEATPLQMASAYAAIAAGGVYHAPSFITKVANRNGKTMFEGPNPGKRVMAPGIATAATDILKSPLQYGTAAGNGLANGRDAAGKTGTTDDFTNAWFVGYTPQLATAVWMGDWTSNKTQMKNIGGQLVYGATYSAPMWKKFMDAVLGASPQVPFPPPTPVDPHEFKVPANSFVSPGGPALLPGFGTTPTTKRRGP